MLLIVNLFLKLRAVKRGARGFGKLLAVRMIWFALCAELILGKQGCDLLYREGIADAEDSAATALKTVQMGSAAKSLSKVACKCADVCAFAAGYSDYGSRETKF